MCIYGRMSFINKYVYIYNNEGIIDKFTRGVYAIRVYGRIPEDVEDDLERKGIVYRPRDGSVKD